MRRASGLLVHGASALVLALAALASGPLVSFVAAPVALLLVAQALAVRRGSGPDAPRRSVGLGLATLGFSLLLLAAAGPAAALLVAVAGLALLLWGTHTALEFDSPPRGQMLPPGFDPLLHAGVAADEAIRDAQGFLVEEEAAELLDDAQAEYERRQARQPVETILTLVFLGASGLCAMALGLRSRAFLRQTNSRQLVWTVVAWAVHLAVFAVVVNYS